MLMAAAFPSIAQGSTPVPLPVLVPESAGKSTTEWGYRSHTHLRVLVAANASASNTAQFNTPATIRSAYALPATGGSGAIALVDAYHYPTALQDFNFFAKQYGLPQETSTNATATGNQKFQVVYATGAKPLSGGNYISSWNMEAALDIEWAHAIAPGAKIYLVEAASDSLSDLNYAVQIASRLTGVKEISMSWGGGEISSEVHLYDSIFTTNGVVYFAAGGDSSALVEYPSVSPNVVSCGGTTLNRSSTGALQSETAWADTGAGLSVYEPRPIFQNVISSIVGNHRGTNDVAFDANPNTGVYVYDTTPLWGETGWWILGGTSVASPCLAGVVNLAAASGNGFAANTPAEQARLYGNMNNTQEFRDVTSGTDGRLKSVAGWDFITGIGTPLGLGGK
jgi:subtilase family serine protease